MNNCVNILKLSIILNKKGFLIKNNNTNLNILKAFLNINIIKFIKIYNNKLLVYVNYKNNKPIFNNIINVFKPSYKKYINLDSLIYLSKKYNWIFIISTNRGILNNFEAINLKTGGLIISVIWN